MAVLRPVSRSFGHRLRLRALHLDTLLRTAGSAPAEEGPGLVVSRGVSSADRYRVAPESGGVRAGLHLASRLTHITSPACRCRARQAQGRATNVPVKARPGAARRCRTGGG